MCKLEPQGPIHQIPEHKEISCNDSGPLRYIFRVEQGPESEIICIIDQKKGVIVLTSRLRKFLQLMFT